jgi:polyisoprenoid-binding protein YceI
MTNEIIWSIDPAHSEITFKIKHLMIANVRGQFRSFTAKIFTLEKDFKTARVSVRIDSASIDTGDEKRDAHLRGADFFDAETYKEIKFDSTAVEQSGQTDSYEIWGDLTIKGITKRVKLNAQFGGIVTDPWGNEKAGFTLRGKINRSDWGLVWNTTLEKGGLMLADEVTISCEIELVKSGQKQPDIKIETGTERASA